MPDYSKSKIYVIRNNLNDLVYVGSTVQSLANRFAKHKSDWKIGKTCPIYKAFSEIGIDNFYIELFEIVTCGSREELCKREGEVIRSFAGKCYNKRIEGRTLKEWYVDNREKMKAYYDTNRDNRICYQKDYYKNKKALKKAKDTAPLLEPQPLPQQQLEDARAF